MKKLILGVLLFLGTIGGVFSQGNQVSKTYIRVFDVKGEMFVDIKNSKINTSTWNEKSVKFELKVIANTSEATINALSSAGRYNIEQTVENGVVKFTMPKSTISVRSVVESYEINIFLPVGVIFLNDLKL
jgi:hypothetical protein